MLITLFILAYLSFALGVGAFMHKTEPYGHPIACAVMGLLWPALLIAILGYALFELMDR